MKQYIYNKASTGDLVSNLTTLEYFPYKIVKEVDGNKNYRTTTYDGKVHIFNISIHNTTNSTLSFDYPLIDVIDSNLIVDVDSIKNNGQDFEFTFDAETNTLTAVLEDLEPSHIHNISFFATLKDNPVFEDLEGKK